MARLPHESTQLHDALNNSPAVDANSTFQMDDIENDPHYLEELALLEQQNKQHAKKRLLVLLGVGLLALCGLFTWLWYTQSEESSATVTAASSTAGNNTLTTNVKPVDPEVNAPAVTLTTPATSNNGNAETPTKPVVPVKVQPITTPIPTDPALAAEELDRITEENSQLKEQTALLEKQIAQTNALIALKTKQLQQSNASK